MNKQINGFTSRLYILLVIALLAVSTSAILVKWSVAPSSVIAAYRLLFTTLLILLPTMIKYKSEIIRMNNRERLYSLMAGVFLAFHFLAWFESLRLTSTASSVVLVTLQPIFAMAGGYYFFQERYPANALLGSIVAIFGTIVISYGDLYISRTALLGDLLALAGAGFVTVYWLLGQHVRKTVSFIPYTFVVYASASLTLFAYNIYFGYDLTGYPKVEWLIFLLLAIVPTILGHTVFNWSVRYIRATTVSMIMLGEPICASLLAYFLLGEYIQLSQIIGGSIILIGLLLYYKSDLP